MGLRKTSHPEPQRDVVEPPAPRDLTNDCKRGQIFRNAV